MKKLSLYSLLAGIVVTYSGVSASDRQQLVPYDSSNSPKSMVSYEGSVQRTTGISGNIPVDFSTAAAVRFSENKQIGPDDYMQINIEAKYLGGNLRLAADFNDELKELIRKFQLGGSTAVALEISGSDKINVPYLRQYFAETLITNSQKLEYSPNFIELMNSSTPLIDGFAPKGNAPLFAVMYNIDKISSPVMIKNLSKTYNNLTIEILPCTGKQSGIDMEWKFEHKDFGVSGNGIRYESDIKARGSYLSKGGGYSSNLRNAEYEILAFQKVADNLFYMKAKLAMEDSSSYNPKMNDVKISEMLFKLS